MRNQNDVTLFNGEPVIIVTKSKEGCFEWVTKASGLMKHSSKQYVKEYMKSHGYKYIFEEPHAKQGLRLV